MPRTIVDSAGIEWVAIEPNKYQQRRLKCVSKDSPRYGEIIFDPRAFGPPPARKDAPRRLDPFVESLYGPAFWEE